MPVCVTPRRAPHPPKGNLVLLCMKLTIFGHRLFSALSPPSLFSRSLLRGRHGTRLKPGFKFRSRPGSMARALGVQSRESWEITSGRHSEHVKTPRPMKTHVQVKQIFDGLRMLLKILLTPSNDCLATSCSYSCAPLSGCIPRTVHGPYRLRSSVWLHSKFPFFCDKPSVMGMITRNLMDNGVTFAAG